MHGANHQEPTYTVSQLCGDIQSFVNEAFYSVWITGELQRVRASARGHLYFELVEKGQGDQIVGKLDGVIWRTDYQRVQRLLRQAGQRLTDGLEIRCRGNLDFWAPAGRLQLVVREVDATFTLGLLEQRRRQTLETLQQAGLLQRNRQLVLPPVPLCIGLVTSEGSAAYHDFLSGLEASGYGFRVLFAHAAVQGPGAERQLVKALQRLARVEIDSSESGRLDAVVVIRGGGARSDLAVFDSRAVAEAVARAPFPVVSGLGHEIDRSITDVVAHSAVKTPTQAAEFLIEQVASVEAVVDDLRRRLRREAAEPLRAARQRITAAEQGLRRAGVRVRAAAHRLSELARLLDRLGRRNLRDAERACDRLRQRLRTETPRYLGRQRQRPRQAAERIAALGRAHVRRAQITVDGLTRLTEGLSPQRTLERGFSITRAADGTLLRSADQVQPGATLRTRLAHGELRSQLLDWQLLDRQLQDQQLEATETTPPVTTEE